MIIKRWEVGELRKLRKWTLVYGRRKTGKTFLIRNFLNYNDYFFVKRDGTIFSDEGTISYETLKAILRRELLNGKTIIIDEFHRLGPEFLDFLHYLPEKGRLIVLTSTLHIGRELISQHSPILGKFSEFPVSLIRIDDVLRALPKTLTPKEKLEAALFLREPWTSELFDPKHIKHFPALALKTSNLTIPSLIGEIFTEEERRYSKIYEGILRAVASGKEKSTEISNYLFSHKLIEKDNPGMIQSYLKILVDLGLLRKITVLGKRYFKYELVSPIMKAFFYADEKYNISELNPPLKEIKGILSSIMGKLIESEIRYFISQKLALTPSVIEGKDFDIDGYFLRFKKGELALEVKWKERITKKDLKKAKETLNRIDAKKKVLFVPKKPASSFEDIEIWDVKDLTL